MKEWKYLLARHPSKRKGKFEFHIPDNGKKAPNDHLFINSHIVLDNKIEDFRIKTCLVAEGHVTQMFVVSRETVCITLTVVALNDLKDKAAEVLNSYVMRPNREKYGQYKVLYLGMMLVSSPLLSEHWWA